MHSWTMNDGPQILRPRPCRIVPDQSSQTKSSSSSQPQPLVASSTSAAGTIKPKNYKSSLEGLHNVDTSQGEGEPVRSQSVLNLTASALAGIFDLSPAVSTSTALSSARSSSELDILQTRLSGSSTPWGMGAHTLRSGGEETNEKVNGRDVREKVVDEKKFLYVTQGDLKSVTGRNALDAAVKRYNSHEDKKNTGLNQRRTSQSTSSGLSATMRFFFRVIVLFLFGVTYGLVVTRLHDAGGVAPVPVHGVNRSSWHYFVTWGLAGVVLGMTMPCVDTLWSSWYIESIRPAVRLDDWYAIVRSMGAFFGVAFAIVSFDLPTKLRPALQTHKNARVLRQYKLDLLGTHFL